MGYLRLKGLFQCLILLCSLFTISLIAPPLEAREDACCEKTLDGDSCVYTALRECDPSYNTAYTTCDQTSFCRPVCCVDSLNGVCYKQVAASTCAQRGGTVIPNSPNCDVQQCRTGCCQIGNQCSIQTERSCQLLTNRYPFLQGQDTFDETITDESFCVNQCRTSDEGCCVQGETCTYTTRAQCTGEFNNGRYCSDTDLACGAQARDHKSCVEGSDDVYWFDSSSNREGIAEDCDYTRGTKCGLVNNQAVCKSLDCVDTENFPTNVHDPQMGKFRYNGESWCVYESGTGDYRDRVGSEHYRHFCINGEEHIDSVRPFREQICIQTTTTDNGRTLSQARLIDNEIYDSAITENISTVQRGLAFWKTADDDRTTPRREGSDVCAEGNVECKVTYIKKSAFSGWNCKDNCQCETQQFIDESARFCKSQGDCGANYNIFGKRSDAGFVVSWEGGRGPKPTTLSEETWQNWSAFGVFGGMHYLQDALKQQDLVTLYSFTEEFTVGIKEYFHKLGFVVGGLFSFPLFFPFLLWNFILGGAKVSVKTLAISCEPWVPPTGGQDCDKCDDDPTKECTEYRCRSLGAACKYLPEDQSCVNANPNEVNSPIISFWSEILSLGFTANSTADGYYIQPNVPIFTPLTFGIKTDELSQCKISDTHTPTFDAMTNYFGSSGYKKEHKITLSVPPGQSYTYYARCLDVNGNPTSNKPSKEYFIQFSADQQQDLTPPQIVSTSLYDGAYVPAGTTETSLTLYLNEPSQCKWSTQDQNYADMPETQVFLCEDEPDQSPLHIRDYACGTQLIGLRDAMNNPFYFRCKDLNNNEQQQSTTLHLQGTVPLQITSVSPQGEIFTNSPTLQATTAAGAEQGLASCTYEPEGFRPIPFFTTGSNQHTQTFEQLPQASYTYEIVCTDTAGNVAQQTTTFIVTTDTRPPRITQIYSDDQTLYVLTNEPATCSYSTTSNTFTREQGLLMIGDSTREHTLTLNQLRYYILCWDAENNLIGPVTVIA